MNLKRIFLPESVTKQLRGLPADQRLHVEAYLENLDVHIATAPPDHVVTSLVRSDEGFLAAVDGAEILFTVDLGSRTAFIQRILLSPPDEGTGL